MESIYTPFCPNQWIQKRYKGGHWTDSSEQPTAFQMKFLVPCFSFICPAYILTFSRRKVSCPKSWCKSDVDPARIRCCHQHRLSNKTYSAIPEQRTRGQLCYTVLPIFFFFSKSSQLITNWLILTLEHLQNLNYKQNKTGLINLLASVQCYIW